MKLSLWMFKTMNSWSLGKPYLVSSALGKENRWTTHQVRDCSGWPWRSHFRINFYAALKVREDVKRLWLSDKADSLPTANPSARSAEWRRIEVCFGFLTMKSVCPVAVGHKFSLQLKAAARRFPSPTAGKWLFKYQNRRKHEELNTPYDSAACS